LRRLISWQPGQSQQAIARQLRIPPSRLVPLVDSLETRGVIERRRDPGDRRNHALYLTDEG
jgi:DNA-binding MarR family transcriptional regulator